MNFKDSWKRISLNLCLILIVITIGMFIISQSGKSQFTIGGPGYVSMCPDDPCEDLEWSVTGEPTTYWEITRGTTIIATGTGSTSPTVQVCYGEPDTSITYLIRADIGGDNIDVKYIDCTVEFLKNSSLQCRDIPLCCPGFEIVSFTCLFGFLGFLVMHSFTKKIKSPK